MVVEWVARNFLGTYPAACFSTFYCDPYTSNLNHLIPVIIDLDNNWNKY